MERHIFTFGYGHQYPNCHQVIHAKDGETARQMMIQRYDNQWAFQYTEAEWEQSLKNGFFGNSKALAPIYCE